MVISNTTCLIGRAAGSAASSATRALGTAQPAPAQLPPMPAFGKPLPDFLKDQPNYFLSAFILYIKLFAEFKGVDHSDFFWL